MAHGSFVVGSIRPVAQNLGLFSGIGAAVWLDDPVYLAWGFDAFAFGYLAVGVWRVGRGDFLGRPTAWLGLEARGVLVEFFRIVKPLLLLPLLLQGAVAVERVVASLISPDSVAALDYARTVSETGIVLLAVPLGFAGLAEFGRLDGDTTRTRLVALLPLLLIPLVPASVFLAVHAEEIVRLLFGRGAFGPESIAATSGVLFGLALGFWAHVAGYVLLKVMNARLANVSAFWITAVAVVFQVLAMLLLYRTLGPLALGIGTSLFGAVSCLLAAWHLGVWREVGSLMTPLIVGTAAYLPAAIAARGDGVLGMAWSLAVFAAFWLAFIGVVPRLRGSLVSALRRSDPRDGDSGMHEDVVLCSTAEWDNPFWTNKQHVASVLAQRGHRVFYIESLGLRRPSASARDLKRILRRVAKAARGPRRVAPGLWVWSPLVLPFQGSRFARAANRLLLHVGLSVQTRVRGLRNELLWTYNPMTTRLLDVGQWRRVVYHCVDDIAEQPGMPAEAIREADSELCRVADVVFTTAPRLAEERQGLNPAIHFLPNVADHSHFGRALDPSTKVPPDLSAIPGPRLGFVGAISGYKVDFDLVRELALARPGWSHRIDRRGGRRGSVDGSVSPGRAWRTFTSWVPGRMTCCPPI